MKNYVDNNDKTEELCKTRTNGWKMVIQNKHFCYSQSWHKAQHMARIELVRKTWRQQPDILEALATMNCWGTAIKNGAVPKFLKYKQLLMQ